MYLANSEGGTVEESESGDVKPPSRRQRNEVEVVNRMKAMKDDPHSPLFIFSHGYILFRSKLLTVIVQGFLTVLVLGILLGIGDSLTGIKHITWIHILHFRISLTNLWLIIMTAVIFATDTAFLLSGARYRLRRVVFPIVFVFVLIAPSSLFHWGR